MTVKVRTTISKDHVVYLRSRIDLLKGFRNVGHVLPKPCQFDRIKFKDLGLVSFECNDGPSRHVLVPWQRRVALTQLRDKATVLVLL